MVKGKLETLQQDLDKATNLVFARCQHYATAATTIRKALVTFFFDKTLAMTLSEPIQANELAFDFHQVGSSLQACLVDEQTLIETAERIKTAATPSLVAALDEHVRISGLPLSISDNVYLFTPEKPPGEKAQIFMQQFAHALSLYRVCLGVCEVYRSISQNSLDTSPHSSLISKAGELQQWLQKPDNEYELTFLWQYAKETKKAMKALLATIHELPASFAQDRLANSSKIAQLFTQGALHLQEGYAKFPNASRFSWLFFDAQWQILLKIITASLFAEKYTYSTLAGSLSIKTEFINTVKMEIDQFYLVYLNKLPLLKLELLRKGYQSINESLTNLKIEAANQGLELTQAPTQSFFPGGGNPIYQMLSTLYIKGPDTSQTTSWHDTSKPR